jgi:hypothetical protein
MTGGILEGDEAPTHWMPIPADPEPTDALPEDFRRIALLFTSRCTRTKMTAGEKRAWASATVKEHDLELLEWFYGLDKSPEFDQTWRRVGMPATLLNNLDAQLDLAFEHKEALRKSQPKLGTAPQWD